MSAYYGYDSPDGRKLHAARRPADGALELAIIIPPSDGWGISIPASDVPSVLEGLREQAGLPDRWQELKDWLMAMPAVNYATVLARMDEMEAGRVSRRIYSRQPSGRFRRATLANTFGLQAPSCPACGRLNPHGVGEPAPVNCHACGAPMDATADAEFAAWLTELAAADNGDPDAVPAAWLAEAAAWHAGEGR